MDGIEWTYEYLPHRGLTEETVRKYEISNRISPVGEPNAYCFKWDRGTGKIKVIKSGQTWWEGEPGGVGLFGQHLFPAGSAKAITICEGLHDAPSIYQALGSKYPSVAPKNGCGSARKDCIAAREYLNSFDKIYLCFDNDDAGHKTVRDIASLFDFNKVFHVKLEKYKDANEYLCAGDQEALRKAWWAATKFVPEGVLASWSEFDKVIDEKENHPGLPIPFSTLQEMTDGVKLGCVFCVKGQEGLGKTEIIRSIESHVLATTDWNIATIHLEERKEEQLERLAGHQLRIPCHLNGAPVTRDQIKRALRDLTKTDHRLHVYAHFESDDPYLVLDTIRFLGSCCDCRLITCDPFNHVVTGLMDEDERKALDMMIMKVSAMARDHNFAFLYSVHTNPDGSARGSKMLTKAAHTVLEVKRDHLSDNEYMRRVTHLHLEKNRPMSVTGPAGKLIFNPETFMLSELSQEVPV